jgi:hypothetical protein
VRQGEVEIFACGLRDASNKKFLRPKPASYPLAYVANSAIHPKPLGTAAAQRQDLPGGEGKPPLEVKSAWNV